jgi:hypothetical protein
MGAFVAAVGQLPPAPAKGVLSWLDNHDSEVVVVRPDRYVLWAGPDLADVTEKLATLLGYPRNSSSASTAQNPPGP